jgi:pimeloyl-ACP methyl ester carboxylesterase
VTTHVIAATDDRFFPVEFQRRLAEDRLGVKADEIPGGHLVALSQPVELSKVLLDTRLRSGAGR